MDESKNTATSKSSLEILVKSFTFRKISNGVFILPIVFLFSAALLISYGIGQVLRLGIITPNGEIDLSRFFQVSYLLSWGAVSLIGYALASMVATYFVLRDVRKHMYESGITVYYFMGGNTFEAALQYLHTMLTRSNLPAPVTGLILVFLTNGVAYPFILAIVEKSIREHARIEEENLFKSRLTTRYTWANLLLDLLLIVVTFGLYIGYMTYRLLKTYNNHIEIVHSTHPEPPRKPYHEEYIKTSYPDVIIVTGILFIAIGLCVLLSFIGFVTLHYGGLSYAPALGLIIMLRHDKSPIGNFLLIFGLLYLLAIGGVYTGIAGSDIYYIFAESAEEYQKIAGQMDFVAILAFIFINNLYVSLPSIIPYIGALTVSQGVFNAGLYLGAYAGARGLNFINTISILIYPHAVLELAAYSILITSTMYFNKWTKYTKMISLGIALLFVAAIIESITITLLK